MTYSAILNVDAKTDKFPEWNLTDFYSSPQDPKFNEDLLWVEESVNKFEKKWQGKLKDASKLTGDEGLGKAISDFQDISERSSKLLSYVYLNYALDVTKPESTKLLSDTQSKLVKYTLPLTFFELELNDLTEDDLKNASQDPVFKSFLPWVETERKSKPHQLSDELEKLFSEKSLTGYSAWNRLFNEVNASSRYLVDGKECPLEETLNYLQNSSEETRKTAFNALAKTFKQHLPTYTLITNTLAKEKEIDDRWHNFKDVADSRHLANNLDAKIVDTLVTTVQEYYPQLAHRYYAIKAKWFNKDKLSAWDRNAPLPSADNTYIPWAEAEKIVLEAYKKFSPRLAELGQKFFNSGWIDAEARPGKASGAFAHPTVPSVHPYLLLNYLGSTRDVMTLAHELGHGVHQILASDQGALMCRTPLTLAETASVFGEMLTFNSLLEQQDDLKSRQMFLAKKVEDMLNTVVRQISFYLFERGVHETSRSQGELTSEQIGQIWMKTQSESLGSAIELPDDYANFWVYVGHFIRSPFYVYSYAFGDCLVNSLYSAYKEGQANFEENYFKLLEAGGTKTHEELLEMFGFDLTTKEFWEKGLSTIVKLIDEIEEIETKLNR